MVCRVGSGAPGTARGRIHWRGRNSLGTRLEGRQLLDCDLPNRRRMPSFAVGGTSAFASHAAAGPEGTGAGGCQRAAFCVQRHVEALLESHCGPGWPGVARAGSIPYHQPFESGGGSGAPGREHAPAGQKQESSQRLKHMRWALLRRGSRVRGRIRQKLNALLASKLATARAWDLKETFAHFWKYKSEIWAGGFLDYWCARAMRSRLEPMKKVARMLRAHEPLILNWFRAKGEISNGAVEGLNNKIRVVTRRSYGFRTYHAMEIALYHNLGRLPEPESPHRFC